MKFCECLRLLETVVEGPLITVLRHKQLELTEAKDSCARWAPMVLRFCELFLGEKNAALNATAETFVRFFHDGESATEGIPVALLDLAFRMASPIHTGQRENLEPLRAAILHLDDVSRAVLILHGAMSLQMPWVAAILNIPAGRANQIWAKSLVEVRARLPEDFFKERRR